MLYVGIQLHKNIIAASPEIKDFIMTMIRPVAGWRITAGRPVSN
jgi:hypothetical protein